MKIKVPATSANLGPGFDCLGLALSIYNEYDVKKSDKMILDVKGHPEWAKPTNIFNLAFKETMKALKKNGSFEAHYKPNIPSSGGLGSSSSVIVAGCMTANILYGGKNKLTNDELLKIATKVEGHPDNVSPALFHGLTASIKLDNGDIYFKKYKVSNKLHFTILYPDFHVSTEKARKLLPKSYKKDDVIKSISHSIMMVEALQNGDFELLKTASKDYIHEPYRKKLIADYNYIKKEVEKRNDSVLLISGSGSALLCISKNKNIDKQIKLKNTKAIWTIKKVNVVN